MRTHLHRPQFVVAAALAVVVFVLAQPLSVLAVNVLPNGTFESFTAHMVNGVLQKWNNFAEYRAQSWNIHETSGAADLHFMDSYQLGQSIAPAYGLMIPNHRIEGNRSQGFGSQASFSFVMSQTMAVQNSADYALGGKIATYWKGPGGETNHGAMFKRIGIDPTGGRTPNGPGVVWTDWDGTDDTWLNPALAVTARGTQATVFIQVENRSTEVISGSLNLGYLDGFRFERAPVTTLNLPAQADPGSVMVTWSATLPDATFWALQGFDVQYRVGDGEWQTVQRADAVGGQAQMYALNAAAGQTYSVRARAWQQRKPSGDLSVPALPGVWVEKQLQVSGDGGNAPGHHAVFLPVISLAPSPVPPPPGPGPTPDPNPTPAPSPTPSPTPPASANAFRLKTVRMLTKTENGDCGGNHHVFLSVVDNRGAPLLGPVIGNPPGSIRVTSGDKNEPFFGYGTKTAEIPLWSNGVRLKVIENPSGTPVTSDQTPLLSTNTWEIPVEWLIGAGYCTGAGDCTGLLCQGHYSYWVVFEAR